MASASGWHHIALGAKEPEVVATFYVDMFGLTHDITHHDPEGQVRSVWLCFEHSRLRLMVERTTHPPRPPHHTDVESGLFLLAFEVSQPERQRLEDKLQASGYPIESRTSYTSYTRDPEGNRVGISCYVYGR